MDYIRRWITCLLLENITTHDSGKYGVHLDDQALYASLSVEGPPDPPQGKPSVVAGAESVTVTWSTSPYDGGSIITGFALEYSLIGSNIWNVAVNNCHSLNYTVHGLKSNSIYVFRVRAINIYGSSPPSLVSDHILVNPSTGNFTTIQKLILNVLDATVVPSLIKMQPQLSFQAKYRVLEEIGKGRYGVVHKIVDKNTSVELSAKIVRCRTAKDRKKLKEEIDIMNLLRHPKLLQLLAAYESQREITLVTEYISGGELFERVVADDFTLTERDCILFTRQICEGVNYMHEQNIVHLDLKPENIMCYTRTSHEIKIIDFGLAQKLNPQIPVRVLFGTAEFVSPEIISYEPIGTKSDMWSIGIICYVLLSGLSPFMGDNDAETFANITRAEYDFNDEAFDAISQNARDFIGALLVKQKENRLSAEECLKHTWLDPEQHQNTVVICKEKLKKFIIRRKWQKTGNAIRAVGRMTNLYVSRRNSSNSITSDKKLSNDPTSKSLSFDEEETTYYDGELETVDSGVTSENSIDNTDESLDKTDDSFNCTFTPIKNGTLLEEESESPVKTSAITINLEINGGCDYDKINNDKKDDDSKQPVNDVWKIKQNGHSHTTNVHDRRSQFEVNKTNEVKKGKLQASTNGLRSKTASTSVASMIQKFDQLGKSTIIPSSNLMSGYHPKTSLSKDEHRVL
ncbi:hypothetical protein FQR65_LT04742 [Abscondita terminalis]|nr:hypothetical protein FQR65_LT04742 [Abscondita terminalis]